MGREQHQRGRFGMIRHVLHRQHAAVRVADDDGCRKAALFRKPARVAIVGDRLFRHLKRAARHGAAVQARHHVVAAPVERRVQRGRARSDAAAGSAARRCRSSCSCRAAASRRRAAGVSGSYQRPSSAWVSVGMEISERGMHRSLKLLPLPACGEQASGAFGARVDSTTPMRASAMPRSGPGEGRVLSEPRVRPSPGSHSLATLSPLRGARETRGTTLRVTLPEQSASSR